MTSIALDRLSQKLGLSGRNLERLRRYEALVKEWSRVKNLVARGTLDDLWRRHILDSVQVQRLLPEARVWADLGSGGGFPGIVTAILLADTPGSHVHLVEADGRKCAFLRAVSRETGLRTSIHHGRIEQVVPTLVGIEGVSARALASLDQLVTWSMPLLEQGAACVFPKGKSLDEELTRISMDSRFEIELHPSICDPEAKIVVLRCDPSHGANCDKS